MKTVIILGSSRKDGDTSKVVDHLVTKSGNCDVIDLNDYEIGYYNYEHQNREDDYLALMKKLITEYDTFIFATPVYWYAMSGIMKVFFDRITDLLEIEQDLGRQLRGKNMAAMSCSIGNNLGDTFWLPFSKTANYLGMNYLGNVHIVSGESNDQKIVEFTNLIEH